MIAAIAQLERELIVERVKNGLRNAKLKGKHIGRVKTRPSEMIRTLLKNGMSHRPISKALRISHGSVSLEKLVMKREEQARREAQKVKEQAEREGTLQVLDEAMPW